MDVEPDKLAELTDHIAAILELPEDVQPAAFERLRDEHPESHAFLIRCEEAASQLVVGGDLRTPLVQSLAGLGGDDSSSDGAVMPDRIGPYEILEVLGEGGMGTVYLAEQHEPIQRRVALKVIKLGMATEDVLARFETERQALARMNHPSIACVLDVGTTAEGQPYFAMEHVPGIRITDYCSRNEVRLEQRIALFQQVCLGVQHAHQKFVLHRDIKPSNILVQDRDGEPLPKIIDFGVAKATDHGPAELGLRTEQGRLLGTPAYMSPEQAERKGRDLDARADVYSLGVVLYELLTGSLPFDARELQRAGMTETQRRIREDEPPKPSTRLTTQPGEETANLAQRFHSEPSALLRALRGDLDWITMRCLEKDPNRRYQSAAELALDLQRYLDHEPVDASPPSAAYRLEKFLRKRRVPVAAGAAIFVALVAGLTVAWSQRGVAVRAAQNARTARGLADRSAASAKAAQTEEVTARKTAETYLAKFNLLADVVKLSEAQAAVAKISPVDPDEIGLLQRWLDEQARPLVAKLPDLKRRCDELGAEASTQSPAEAEQGTFRFAEKEKQFLHDTLSQLVADLAAFARPEVGGVAKVEARLAWAETVRGIIDDHRSAWVETIAEIAASPKYGGLQLSQQPGLVPIGRDPRSELYEFAHPSSGHGDGAIPMRSEDGELIVTGDMGIVFVLIPGGTFTMGAQKDDPTAPNYDPHAEPGEGPPHEVTLAPFFLAKHEMTQMQWRVLSGGETPSNFRAETNFRDEPDFTWAQPVETVSWTMCAGLSGRHGLALPTEAQWEYACRAGTNTPWSTGRDVESLQGFANLADRHAKESVKRFASRALYETVLDDGWTTPAPVGSFAANAFGLHDMHGNVWEQCRDGGSYAVPPRMGDGLREPRRPTSRGGSYHADGNDIPPARLARVSNRRGASRVGLPPTGFRPSRQIDP